MDINENGTFDVTEKAEVNVQVVAKPEKPYIDSSKLKCGAYMFSNDYGTDLRLLENLDSSEMVYMERFCYNRLDLTEAPKLNTINCQNCISMFSGCKNMTGKIVLDSPKVTSFNSAFQLCQKVTEISINTDSCTNIAYAFAVNYGLLEMVTLTDTSKVISWVATFNQARQMHTVNGELTMQNTNACTVLFNSCTGLENIRYKYIGVTSNGLSFASCSKLSVESLLSILNALSDNTALDTTYTVTLGSANLEKLTEEQKEIAYSKNIALA
jgi:hypothetical protein